VVAATEVVAELYFHFLEGCLKGIVALERVSVVECVCHDQKGAAEEFFYMYMCHFLQLHMRLSFDEFTMGVLRLLNVAPTQLHLNSWRICRRLGCYARHCTCSLLHGRFFILLTRDREVQQLGCRL